MVYLFVFGAKIEDRMGHWWFILFYFLSGLAGNFLYVVTNHSSLIPAIGASGAISGILGAYLAFYPMKRQKVFFGTVNLPVFVSFGSWFLFQLLLGWVDFSLGIQQVGWFAHVGGFLSGMLLAWCYMVL